jgi:hypothetical protein
VCDVHLMTGSAERDMGVKVKLSLTMRTHIAGTQAQLHSISTSAIGGGTRLTSCNGCFTPRQSPRDQ